MEKRGADSKFANSFLETRFRQAGGRGIKDFMLWLLLYIIAEDTIGERYFLDSADRKLEIFVKMLLEKGVDTDLTDGDGWTALHLASYSGRDQIVKLLLDKGADVHNWTGVGYNALHLASDQGQENLMQILLDNGADVNVSNGAHNTALILASRKWS